MASWPTTVQATSSWPTRDLFCTRIGASGQLVSTTTNQLAPSCNAQGCLEQPAELLSNASNVHYSGAGEIKLRIEAAQPINIGGKDRKIRTPTSFTSILKHCNPASGKARRVQVIDSAATLQGTRGTTRRVSRTGSAWKLTWKSNPPECTKRLRRYYSSIDSEQLLEEQSNARLERRAWNEGGIKGCALCAGHRGDRCPKPFVDSAAAVNTSLIGTEPMDTGPDELPRGLEAACALSPTATSSEPKPTSPCTHCTAKLLPPAFGTAREGPFRAVFGKFFTPTVLPLSRSPSSSTLTSGMCETKPAPKQKATRLSALMACCALFF
eukprot:6211279-Pleurochrysis_carterae.AAC.6